jgi:hypothetical protein
MLSEFAWLLLLVVIAGFILALVDTLKGASGRKRLSPWGAHSNPLSMGILSAPKGLR